MPTTPHIERHFTATDTVRDIVIGMSDGLTVPFALAAGLSGAVDSTGLIITAGLAEVAAGAIPMRNTLPGNGLAKNVRPESYLKPKPPRSPRFSVTMACPRRR
jgi:ABC-type sulfate/molybdate transport systems ATPase subunit